MKKLIKWLKSGGGFFIGWDNSDEPMFTVTNGQTLMILTGIAVACALALFMYYRLALFIGKITG